MKRRLLQMTIALILILIIPISTLLCGTCLPDYYGDSYYAQLSAMYQRLRKAEGKKIILVGGSNVAFGVDTALLEQLLNQYGHDYTVCPFGLYAAVGTSAMLELSKDTLREGDIVILAIEPSSETMSTYFGATAFWKCSESNPLMLTKVNKTQASALVGNYLGYLQERYSIFTSGNLPKTDGVYAKSSFDEDCNMIYDRAGNAMALGYDTATPVDLAAVSIEAAFTEQVRKYCAYADSVGAQVWFSFSPVNRSALVDSSDGAVNTWFSLCNETFPCPVISDPNDYILDAGWFYDNNFHLNSAGAKLRTYLLAQDILTQLDCYQPLVFDLPEMPDSIAKVESNDANTAYFAYEAFGSGYLISGLTADGLAQAELTVPSAYEGRPIVGFTADALSRATTLEELTLPQSIESLPDGLFQNCTALERLILEHKSTACTVTENTFTGAAHVKIFVPTEAYSLYRDGTGCETNPWQLYLDRIYTFG